MGSGREDLGGGIEAMKGVYQSIRMAEVFSPTFWTRKITDKYIRAANWLSTLTSRTQHSGRTLAFISWPKKLRVPKAWNISPL